MGWKNIGIEVGKPRDGQYEWCRCDCGREAWVRSRPDGTPYRTECRTCSNQKKWAAAMGAVRAAATKHGHYSGDRASPTLKCWDAMVQRCTNPNATGYALYGGAGVMVCERWLGEYGFVNFLADMGERPSRGHSLDRYPNAHGNYEPGNVRWATHQEQMLNRPGYNRVYTLNGETMCHAEWARRYGISDALLRQRLKKWPLEVALTKPVRQSAPRKNE